MYRLRAPVRHVGLAPEDEQHVDAAGPGAHRPPVLLHPEPHHGVLEILNKWEHNLDIFPLIED